MVRLARGLGTVGLTPMAGRSEYREKREEDGVDGLRPKAKHFHFLLREIEKSNIIAVKSV